MKYSFCFVIKKIIRKNSSKSGKAERIYIQGKNKEKIEMICGPWRNTEEEAKHDEALFRKDKKAFFKMVEKKQD
ncbi:MAG: hypothetical protein PHF84_05165 [bacterium]|nr:hypothetical protein [bacterium]